MLSYFNIISYIEVNASTSILVKKTKKLVYKNSSDARWEKKTVEILQLLLAQLSVRALFIEASTDFRTFHSRNPVMQKFTFATPLFDTVCIQFAPAGYESLPSTKVEFVSQDLILLF